MDRIQKLKWITWSKLILHHVNLPALVATAMTQVLQHQRRVLGFTLNTAEIELVAKGEKK